MNDFVAPEAPATTSLTAAQDIKLPDAPPARAGVGGGARVMIQTPQGQTVDRTSYIRALAKASWSRGQIVTHIQDITGDKSFKYQAVFSVTKDLYAKRGEGRVAPGAPSAPIVTAEDAPPAV